MITHYIGRPDSDEGRSEVETRTYDFLDSIGIQYETVCHEATYTMEQCQEIEKTLGVPICKNLFLCNRQKTAFYLLMIPGDKVFKTSELSRQIGSSRLSFAGAEDMLRLLDVTPGSVSVLALMNDRENRVRLLMDEQVLAGEYVGCHPCINTSSLRLRTADLIEKILPAMHHGMTAVSLVGEV